MEVKLLNNPQDIINIIHTACRTCYSRLTPIEIYNKNTYENAQEEISEEQIELDKNKKIELIKKVMDSGHLSTTEHAYFTFAISGVSRALMAQLTRHRMASFSIQSQRYVEIKENSADLLVLKNFGTYQDKLNMLTKYFVLDETDEIFFNAYLDDLISYSKLIEKGYLAEQARKVLPSATKTNIVLSCNLRELIHICHLRLCKHAQLEIRNLLKLMVSKVLEQENCDWLKKYLTPNCKNCTDFRDCKGVK